MHKKSKIAFGIAMLAAATSCSVDEITIPASELITREFIKTYGKIDPNHDWSVIKSSNITVTSPQQADVRIIARDGDGKSILLADLHDFSGTETIYFDVPKEVENVYVQSGTQFHTVNLGESVSLTPAPARSRGIDGTDQGVMTATTDFGYHWDYEYVKAFTDVLPEGQAQHNLVKDAIITDFSFIASDKAFEFYPMFWETGAHNVLGVYWYENGELKTRDVFSTRVTDDWHSVVTLSPDCPNNMYRKATEGLSDIKISSSSEGKIGMSQNGEIVLSFSIPVQWSGDGSAELSIVRNVDGVEPTQLGTPIMSDDGTKATFKYENLIANTEYTFSISANAFKSKSIATKTYAFNFRTLIITPIIESISPDPEPNTPIERIGTITITYDKEIKEGDAAIKATLKAIGNSEATTYISDGVVSGKTLSFDYEVSHNELRYEVTINAGAVKSLLYDEPNDGASFQYTTRTDPIKYNPIATIMKFIYPEGTDKTAVLAEDDNLTATIITNKGIDRVEKCNYDWTFRVPGHQEPQVLNPQITSKSKGLTTKEDLSTPAMDKSSTFEITVQKDMVLSVYGSCKSDNLNNANLRLFSHSKNADIKTDARILSGTMTGLKQVRFRYIVEPGTYTLCYDSGQGGFIAGLSYQLITQNNTTDNTNDGTPQATSRKFNTNIYGPISRAEDNITEIRPTYESTVAAESAGYTRLHKEVSSYVDTNGHDGGKDEIVTHKISIKLPKGTVFGFYIRNNHGAHNLTNTNGNKTTVPYTNYSMSALNEELPNSFFKRLDTNATDYSKFVNGWGDEEKTTYLKGTKYEDSRKFSTAATYKAPNGYSYFSFEDWVDGDLNDIVFMVAPESQNDIIDLEVETEPYIFAVEDLGAVASTGSDIDFNDVVFGVEHVKLSSDKNYLFVTMLAAGGTLKAQLQFDGKPIDGVSDGQTIVHGPHVGTGKRLEHINQWFDEDDYSATINVGTGHHGFGNLTTVRIPIHDDNYTLAAKEGEAGKFSIVVVRPDGTYDNVTEPKAYGEAPQILILPGSWRWPKEGTAIHDAYNGGVNFNGELIPSFEKWVNNQYSGQDWHKNPVLDYVILNPWEGSQAARDEIKNNQTQQ